jgi:hypothetical protein
MKYLKEKTVILSFALFLFCIFNSCSTLGTVSRSYRFSKQDIWSAMTDVIVKNYGSIKRVDPNPPTIVSNLSIKDKVFGVEKTSYQVYASLSGFSRPFVVDVEVRVFPTGQESTNYKVDRQKAQEILEQIDVLLEYRRHNASIQDRFLPY